MKEYRNPVQRDTSLAARMLLLPIVAYRRWISPGLPPRCRFYPSCSEYAVTAITTHGALRGLGLALWRLLRCHPFHPGGIDYVPPPRARPEARRKASRADDPGGGQRPSRAEHRDDVTGAVTR